LRPNQASPGTGDGDEERAARHTSTTSSTPVVSDQAAHKKFQPLLEPLGERHAPDCTKTSPTRGDARATTCRIHQSGIGRLHPERGAPFQLQLVARHDRQQIRGLVASRMADPIVELRPSIRVQGHRENQDAVVFEHTAHFAEDPSVILNVLDDIKGTDKVNSDREWQCIDSA
jgi:hypothetical protein